MCNTPDKKYFEDVASKDHKKFMQEPREVSKAPTEDAAFYNLDLLLDEHLDSKYSLAIKSWRNNWVNLAIYFKYPEEVRNIIYTTNAVEALHRRFRKVTKSKSLFPNSLSRFIGNDALKKMPFLAYRELSKKWTMQLRNWAIVISNFSIYFKDRFAVFT